jgi:hypothetical protein
VQPPFRQAGAELGLAVAAVGGGCDLGGGDDDERRACRSGWYQCTPGGNGEPAGTAM